MSRSTTLISSSEPSSRNHNSLTLNSVDASVGHVKANYSFDLISFHYQIQHKIFNEERTVVAKRSPKESMQHRVTCPISNSTTSICLSPFTILEGLTSKSSLINFSLFSSRKRHSVRFQLDYRLRSLFAHVVNGILITQPVCSLHSVVGMPPPVVFSHISKGGVDPSLRCNCMRTSGEKFRYTSSFKT